MRSIVIAIDGPAGAGKSTVAKALAQDLGLRYLDTGAMYRCLALRAQQAGIEGSQGEAAAALLNQIEITFGPGDPQTVWIDGEEVTASIRQPEIGELASQLSAHGPVRQEMVRRQQAIVADGGVTLEGRDATTVIAPYADVKVYLTASLEERARRRTEELLQKGMAVEFQSIRHDVELRDHRDITRSESPLTVAQGAHIVESGGWPIAEVVARIKALIPLD
ncbi:MAG: (d)CMP kinase [Fimbriimonas sp.]